MDEETYIRFDHFLFQVQRSEKQVDVMDPYHIFVTFDLEQVLDKLLVDVAISMPHLSISFVNVIFVHSFKVVEQRPHELLVEKNIFFDIFSFQPDRYTVLGLE